MKINSEIWRNSSTCRSAFTLIEAVVGVAIVGIVFVSLYTGVTFTIGTIRIARESLQATQVIQSKMEVMRLYSWSQVTTNNFIPATFQQAFLNAGQTNGLTYSGTVVVTNAPVTESYSNSLKQIIVTLTWQSGSQQRQRQMSTLVSQYGMQNYIY
jgi:type II secretory pathway pseudopilin PulG